MVPWSAPEFLNTLSAVDNKDLPRGIAGDKQTLLAVEFETDRAEASPRARPRVRVLHHRDGGRLAAERLHRLAVLAELDFHHAKSVRRAAVPRAVEADVRSRAIRRPLDVERRRVRGEVDARLLPRCAVAGLGDAVGREQTADRESADPQQSGVPGGDARWVSLYTT